jgi:DNA-binding CsgD family transcriptional regulator
MHRGSMDRIKKFQSEHALPHGRANRPREFVFVDKKTGVRRFEIKADKNGGMPMEQAVSLLAIHCVAHQQTPGDFGVMVAAGEELLAGIAARATKLIQSCSGSKLPGFALSRRQREVLSSITQNLSNKEIAAKLNVSVRTIKFHVSSLLEKFDVRGRVDLMLQASAFLPVDNVRKRANGVDNFTTRINGANPAALGPLRYIPLLPAPSPKLRLAASADRTTPDPFPFDDSSHHPA